MPKMRRHEGGLASFRCPGCDDEHVVRIEGAGAWGFNGDMDHPTLTPSVLVRYGDGSRCHSFVRDGRIEFLSDCSHALAGQTVELPERPGIAT